RPAAFVGQKSFDTNPPRPPLTSFSATVSRVISVSRLRLSFCFFTGVSARSRLLPVALRRSAALRRAVPAAPSAAVVRRADVVRDETSKAALHVGQRDVVEGHQGLAVQVQLGLLAHRMLLRFGFRSRFCVGRSRVRYWPSLGPWPPVPGQ